LEARRVKRRIEAASIVILKVYPLGAGRWRAGKG
jgi:hypothetical protein